ncbi:MucBP domain-containing protein [Carnobacterium gallinarum]|uniref:MucBP domain-containing protein n=1 Tax=Carnobacterium gallinarum TaxID=2749 RepID=UPI00068C4C93|nr:MucBP domain-containing protein [Carnobacterium gallinarum]
MKKYRILFVTLLTIMTIFPTPSYAVAPTEQPLTTSPSPLADTDITGTFTITAMPTDPYYRAPYAENLNIYTGPFSLTDSSIPLSVLMKRLDFADIYQVESTSADATLIEDTDYIKYNFRFKSKPLVGNKAFIQLKSRMYRSNFLFYDATGNQIKADEPASLPLAYNALIVEKYKDIVIIPGQTLEKVILINETGTETDITQSNIMDTYAEAPYALTIKGQPISGKPNSILIEQGTSTVISKTPKYQFKFIYSKQVVLGADVTARYQDEQGNQIATDETFSGNVGDNYATNKLDIPGYTFKEVKGNVNGQYTDKAQEVIYIYTKNPIKGADVTVRYQDEQGIKIAVDAILSGDIGKGYITKQLTILGYTFKEVKGNKVGWFTDQQQETIYVYTKDPVKGADVTVRYQDEQGNTLSKDEVLSGNVGENYTSKELTIKGYTFKEVKGNSTGQFTNQVQEVIYIYTKDPVKGADVTVRYQDEQGNTLSKDVILSGNIGENYKSKELGIKGYTFKEVKGNVTGQFTDKAQEVIYVYTKDAIKGADVTVRYQDEQGNTLLKDEVLSGNIGENYTSKELAIKGYTFKEVKGNSTGQFTDKVQEVIYIYTKDPVKGADVTVRYQDEQGNSLSKDVILSGNVGENYISKELTIKGYTFKEVKGNSTGQFTDKVQEVIYIYTKDPVKGADVTVRYQDEQGNTLSKDEVLSGNIGENYTSKELVIKGYTFKEVKGNVTGQFTDKAQEVIYVYTKDAVKGADVTVRYQDEQGNTLSKDEVLSGNIGENYTSKELTIKGYTFKEVKGNSTGQFTNQVQEVIYIYTKDSVKGADVTVRYQDEQGNTLSKDEVLSGNVGENYTSKELGIKGYTFKEVKGNSTGQFTDKVQEVIYVYTKDAVKGADVTVRYQDEQGNTLSKDVILSGNVGENYTTKQLDIKGYMFKEIQGNSTGTFTDKAQDVIYIYTKNLVVDGNTNENHSDQGTSNGTQIPTPTPKPESHVTEFPQTGEMPNYLTLIIGLLALFGAISILFSKKRSLK